MYVCVCDAFVVLLNTLVWLCVYVSVCVCMCVYVCG